MIIVEVKNGNIEQALKKYKAKVAKTKQLNKLRDRKEFVKPSIMRRNEIRKATYIQKLKTNSEKDS